MSSKRKAQGKRKPSPERRGTSKQGGQPPRRESQLPASEIRRSPARLSVRKLPDEDAWELVHPRCVLDRVEDLDEVRAMLDAGEVDVARDECRWLLDGCPDCLEAHRILGEIALGDDDLPLARGHFGHAYRQANSATQQAGSGAVFPYRLPANQALFEAAKGLVWCLKQLDKPQMAAEVIARVVALDPNDPLGIRGILDQGSSP